MPLKALAGLAPLLPARQVSPEHQTVLQGLRDPAFMMGEKYAAQQLRADREGAHADILAFYDAFQRQLRALGVPMFAHIFVRSSSAQDAAFSRGVSRAQAGQSPHNFGFAVDVIHSRRGWELSQGEWRILGHIGKDVASRNQLRIDWGGDFESIYDPAHWEMRRWRTLL